MVRSRLVSFCSIALLLPLAVVLTARGGELSELTAEQRGALHAHYQEQLRELGPIGPETPSAEVAARQKAWAHLYEIAGPGGVHWLFKDLMDNADGEAARAAVQRVCASAGALRARIADDVIREIVAERRARGADFAVLANNFSDGSSALSDEDRTVYVEGGADEVEFIKEFEERFQRRTGLTPAQAEMTLFSGRATHPDWRFSRDIVSFKLQLKRKYAEIGSNPEAYLLEGGLRTEVELATWESTKKSLRRFAAGPGGKVTVEHVDAREHIFRGFAPAQARGYAFDVVVSNILMSDHHLGQEDFLVALAKYVHRSTRGAWLQHAPEKDGRIALPDLEQLSPAARRRIVERIFQPLLIGEADRAGIARELYVKHRVDAYASLLDTAVLIRRRKADLGSPQVRAEIFGELAARFAEADGVDLSKSPARRGDYVETARRSWENSCREMMAAQAVATAPERMIEWLRPATPSELEAVRRQMKRENPSRAAEVDRLDLRELQSARKASAFWSLKEALVHLPENRYLQMVEVVRRGLMTQESQQVQDLLHVAARERGLRLSREAKLSDRSLYRRAAEGIEEGARRLANRAQDLDAKVHSGEYSYRKLASRLTRDAVVEIGHSFGLDAAGALARVSGDPAAIEAAKAQPAAGLNAEVLLNNTQSVLMLARTWQQCRRLPADERAFEIAKAGLLEVALRSRFLYRLYAGSRLLTEGDWKPLVPEIAPKISEWMLRTVFERGVAKEIARKAFGAPVALAAVVHLGVQITGHWALDPLGDSIEDRIYQGFDLDESSWFDLGLRTRAGPETERRFDDILLFVPETIPAGSPGFVSLEELESREQLLLELPALLERAADEEIISREERTVELAGEEVTVDPYGELRAFVKRKLNENLASDDRLDLPPDVRAAKQRFERKRAAMWAYFESELRRRAAQMTADLTGCDPAEAAGEYPEWFESARSALLQGGEYDLGAKRIAPENAFFQVYARQYMNGAGAFFKAIVPTRTGNVTREEMAERLAMRLMRDYQDGYGAWVADEAAWDQAAQISDLVDALDAQRWLAALDEDWNGAIFGAGFAMAPLARVVAEHGVTRPKPRVRLSGVALLPEEDSRYGSQDAVRLLSDLDVQVRVDAQDDLYPLPWIHEWRVTAGGKSLETVHARKNGPVLERLDPPGEDSGAPVEALVYSAGFGPRKDVSFPAAQGAVKVEVIVYASRAGEPGERGEIIGRDTLEWKPPAPSELPPVPMSLARTRYDHPDDVPGDALEEPFMGQPFCIVYPIEIGGEGAAKVNLDIGRMLRGGKPVEAPKSFSLATPQGRRFVLEKGQKIIPPARYRLYTVFKNGLEAGDYEFDLAALWQPAGADEWVRYAPSVIRFRVKSLDGLQFARAWVEPTASRSVRVSQSVDGRRVTVEQRVQGDGGITANDLGAGLQVDFPARLVFDVDTPIPAALTALVRGTGARAKCYGGDLATFGLVDNRDLVLERGQPSAAGQFQDRVDSVMIGGRDDPVAIVRIAFSMSWGTSQVLAQYTRDGKPREIKQPPPEREGDFGALVSFGGDDLGSDLDPGTGGAGGGDPPRPPPPPRDPPPRDPPPRDPPPRDPPPPAPPPRDPMDRFAGEWSGRVRIDSLRSSDPDDDYRQAIGRSFPATIRIVKRDGRYQVLVSDIEDGSMSWPEYMPLSVDGDSIIANYRGAAVDTEGNRHAEMQLDIRFRFTVKGDSGTATITQKMSAEDLSLSMSMTATVTRR